jgi:hypothetical protein
LDNEILLAVVNSLVEDAFKKIEIPEAIQGPRGFKGKDGNDFNLEDHQDEIVNFIIQNMPTDISLTVEQLESLQGSDGRDGKDGKDGRDFDPQENLELIREAIEATVAAIRDSLTLKFSNLTDEEVESLRGPRGQRGKPGKDFSLDESSEFISSTLNTIFLQNKNDLKLKFEDLKEHEVDSLKLKFEDLTPENLLELKGPRGQRGKQGIQGESIKGDQGEVGAIGPRGPIGARGPIGLSGKDGIGLRGADGKDGKDAPIIEEVNLIEDKDYISLEFNLSDGSQLITNEVKLKRTVQNFYSSGGGSSEMPVNYIIEIDTVSPDLTYVGEAAIGSDKSQAVWRIQRITKSGSNVEVLFADENDFFDNIWDDRLSLTYG